ncbi:hypothetical protein H4R20_001592 [Coemansia guatemalensis]|uniref:ubiquitinyl hydrolase 1 n=1 Tax=Coemansia guatemalensis TaxID=2761395 RepID=A0A9W8HZ62_9FUNG|nr:hypothetical protein H4R20_001592 [Coemansia guatemalensis]
MGDGDSGKIQAPGITVTVTQADDSRSNNLSRSSSSSPQCSYLHTPAEPYDGNDASGSTVGLAQFLQKSEIQREAVSVSSLQREIDDAEMDLGSVWYLVARKWYAAWQEWASGLVPEKMGAIDNTSIVDSNGELQPGLKLGEDLEAVPASAWRKMVELYGIKGQLDPVRRVVVQSVEDSQAVLELYPPSVFAVPRASFGWSDSEDARRIVISLGASVGELKWQIQRVFEVEANQRVTGLFCPMDRNDGGAADHAKDTSAQQQQRPPTYEAAMADDDELSLQQLKAIADSDATTLMAAGILPDSIVVFETATHAGNEEDAMVTNEEASSETDSSSPMGMFNEFTHSNWDSRATSGNLPSPGTDDDDGAGMDETAVARAGTVSQEHYRCGLNNLGNTCFMNSALQCLGHFGDFTQYFVSNVYTTELNRENPLGMKGAVAAAYGRLVKAMWDIGCGAYAPRAFKQTVAQWAPQFRGYNQQDAHEFLAFFLDGMHEDLNRIVHKPYIEVPDADGRPDGEVADEQWDIYKRRNDSVVVDLFQGQYRSTLVCPECGHVSVTFDPFMYLTLPMPVQRQKWIEVLYVPANTGAYATRMQLLVRKEDTIQQLKQVVAHLAQCDAARLLACDIMSMRIYAVYSDDDSLGDIRDSEVVHMYEIGVDAAKVAADPASEPAAVVQLLCTRPSAPSSYSSYSYNYGPDIVTKPIFLTLPSGELTLGELYLQIANALSRWTTIDMTRITTQLQRACAGEEFETDERLLELLGQAAYLSVHRGTSSTSGRSQYRNLSSISSYMYPGRRAGPPNAFRAFTDRINNDSCEPLVESKTGRRGSDAMSSRLQDEDPTETTSVMHVMESIAPADDPAGLSSRRRARPDDDVDDYSSKWDSSSDNDGDCAMHATPKRARSDNGSDVEAKREVDQIIPRSAVPAAQDAPDAPGDPNSATEEATKEAAPALHAEDEETCGAASNSDDDIASATAALSFADMLGTTVQLSTGDTLLCDWNDEGTKALLAALASGKDESETDLVKEMFDFDRVDAYTMPQMEDATQYKEIEPIGVIGLDQPPRVAARPPSEDNRQQRKITLEDCLAEFTRPEELGEEDPWYCSKCKEHQRATKKFDLWRVPEILVVHLKRFEHSRAWRDKIDAFVDFPLRGLDLTRTVVGPSGCELMYDLHSVCNHFGGMGGGHYTAYALSPEDAKWYDFNDSHVSEVSDSESVKTAAAYMLFYRLRPAASAADGAANKSAAAEKIDRLIADYKEHIAAQGDAAPADNQDGREEIQSPSDLSMQSPRAMDTTGDDSNSDAEAYTSNLNNALVSFRPAGGMDSPRSDLGNASDEDADRATTSARDNDFSYMF